MSEPLQRPQLSQPSQLLKIKKLFQLAGSNGRKKIRAHFAKGLDK